MKIHGLTVDTVLVVLIAMMGVLMVKHDFFLACIDEGPMVSESTNVVYDVDHKIFSPEQKDVQPVSNKPLWKLADKTASIELDKAYLSQLLTGDEFQIPAKTADGYYQARIIEVLAFKNGDRTWRANIETSDDVYSVTLSIGKQSIYGLVNTPEGMYSLKGQDENITLAEIYQVEKFQQKASRDTAMTIIRPLF